MKKEVLMKLVLIISIVGILMLTSIQVYADIFDDDDDEGTSIDFSNQYNELTNNGTQNENANANANANANLNGVLNGNTNANNNNNGTTTGTTDSNIQNQNLPYAGIADQSYLIVLIFVFGISAFIAYIKLREYKNI